MCIRNQRICILFEKDIGDEFHYIMTCSAFRNNYRKRYLPSKYTNILNTLKFLNLFSCKNIIRNPTKFINVICKRANPPG
jgi:hypothetical protein